MALAGKRPWVVGPPLIGCCGRRAALLIGPRIRTRFDPRHWSTRTFVRWPDRRVGVHFCAFGHPPAVSFFSPIRPHAAAFSFFFTFFPLKWRHRNSSLCAKSGQCVCGIVTENQSSSCQGGTNLLRYRFFYQRNYRRVPVQQPAKYRRPPRLGSVQRWFANRLQVRREMAVKRSSSRSRRTPSLVDCWAMEMSTSLVATLDWYQPDVDTMAPINLRTGHRDDEMRRRQRL